VRKEAGPPPVRLLRRQHNGWGDCDCKQQVPTVALCLQQLTTPVVWRQVWRQVRQQAVLTVEYIFAGPHQWTDMLWLSPSVRRSVVRPSVRRLSRNRISKTKQDKPTLMRYIRMFYLLMAFVCRPIKDLLSRRSRQPDRLDATGVSVSSSFCCHNAKKRDFSKTKQFRAMVSIDDP